MKHKEFPWTIPVPIKSSTFVPLFPKHKKFNVEVDLAKISAFSGDIKPVRHEQIVDCDMQTNPDVNVGIRLGSGRSGYFMNHYLKGIGRTSLAGNWNDKKDVYHSSGSLLTSAAVREYLVSLFLLANRKSHLANICQGILLKPVSQSLGKYPSSLFRGKRSNSLCTINRSQADWRYQAITVKKGDFSRYSNIVWWLDRFPQTGTNGGPPTISSFFKIFYHAFFNFNSKFENLNPTADEIAKKFAEIVEKALHQYMEAWSIGLNWGSLHNNFTIDGRYLDLETPRIYPFPAIAVDAEVFSERHKKSFTVGCDSISVFSILSYVQQLRYFLKYLNMKLSFLCEFKAEKNEVIFIKDFLDALKIYFNRDHPLISSEKLSHLVLTYIVGTLNLSSKLERRLHKMFMYTAKEVFPELKNLPTEKRIDVKYCGRISIARSEPHVTAHMFLPKLLRDLDLEVRPLNALFNQTIIQADRMKDRDKLLEFLTNFTEHIYSTQSIENDN